MRKSLEDHRTEYRAQPPTGTSYDRVFVEEFPNLSEIMSRNPETFYGTTMLPQEDILQYMRRCAAKGILGTLDLDAAPLSKRISPLP